jgi:hypothetical protein
MQATPTPTPDPNETEELVHHDDAVIGRAFRWSAVAVVLIGITVALSIFVATRKPHPPAARLTKVEAPIAPRRSGAQFPSVRFTDITKEAGINFIHNTGAYGEKLLPETMGSGVAFLDYDNDGNQDLLFINSTWWPGHIPDGAQPTTMHLYHNDGHGHFTDVTAGSGLDVPIYGMGVAVGDYDNDGLPDIFVTGVGGYRLFHNEGNGKFKDVTQEAGVGGSADDWGTSACFFDYDNDGKVDLFVCNYVRWSRDIDFQVNYTLDGQHRAYGPPMNFQGSFCRLYHNDGNGHFTDVSAKAGIQVKNPATGVPAGKSLGVVPIDLDGDGYLDLVVANDTVQNFAFHNQRDGTFKEIGFLTGVAFDPTGAARGAMGIDAGHIHNDDSLGIGIGNFANEMVALYVSHGQPLLFTDDAIAEGVGPVSRMPLKFGLFFFDYDLDGWLDLLTANGHIEHDIGRFQHGMTYAQPAQLFWNGGAANQSFLPVGPDKAGPDLFKPIVGRGSAFADIDNDGDLDVVLTQTGGPPLLLRNDQQTGHHFIRLKLIGNGTTCNRDAIGAQIKVSVHGQTLWRQVMPTRSYLSQSELPVTIGLGAATHPDSVEITWPGGQKQPLNNVKLDALTTVRQSP